MHLVAEIIFIFLIVYLTGSSSLWKEVVRFFVIVYSYVNAKKAEHELLALFTEISIVNRYDLFFNLTQETQYFTVIHK